MRVVYTVTAFRYGKSGEGIFGVYATSAGADAFLDKALWTLTENHGYKVHWDKRFAPDDEDFCVVREARVTLTASRYDYIDKRFQVKRWRLKP